MKIFLLDFLWFLRNWKPINIKWNSPRYLWRMAMRRERIRKCIKNNNCNATKSISIQLD